jgi:hypothetical protein
MLAAVPARALGLQSAADRTAEGMLTMSADSPTESLDIILLRGMQPYVGEQNLCWLH